MADTTATKITRFTRENSPESYEERDKAVKRHSAEKQG